jgi:spore germination cell wall hydrolase CwlJ-like protein
MRCEISRCIEGKTTMVSSAVAALSLLLLVGSANAFSVQQRQTSRQRHQECSSSSSFSLPMTAKSIDTKDQVKVGVIGALVYCGLSVGRE